MELVTARGCTASIASEGVERGGHSLVTEHITKDGANVSPLLILWLRSGSGGSRGGTVVTL